MTVIEKVNGQKLSKRQMAAWEKNRREVFGVVPPWEVPGSAPAIRTADTFFRGKKQGVTNEDFDDRTLARYRQIAEAAGVSTHNKFYFGSIASDAADPEAWCADEADVIATLKRKKLCRTIRGTTYDFSEHRDEPSSKDQPYEVAQDIVDGHVERRVQEEYDGRATPHDRQRIEQEVREDITTTW